MLNYSPPIVQKGNRLKSGNRRFEVLRLWWRQGKPSSVDLLEQNGDEINVAYKTLVEQVKKGNMKYNDY